LLFVVPILTLLVLAIVEFSLLLSASQHVKAASHQACRVGTLPVSDPQVLEKAVREAAVNALIKPRLIQAHELLFRPGLGTGDPVVVEVRVPMKSASPDLLGLVGFCLQGRKLVGRTVMRKE
jgi:hypothetical protein